MNTKGSSVNVQELAMNNRSYYTDVYERVRIMKNALKRGKNVGRMYRE